MFVPLSDVQNEECPAEPGEGSPPSPQEGVPAPESARDPTADPGDGDGGGDGAGEVEVQKETVAEASEVSG